MKIRRLGALSSRGMALPRLLATAAALGLALLIAGCPAPPRRGPDGAGGTGPVGPKPVCPSGALPIGVLAVTSNIVYRNGVPARSGDRVCNGDHISTNATGVGDLLLDGDQGSDTVHFAEGTDPSVTLTPNGCVSVDAYTRGTVIANARRRCMLLRTRDTLLLLVNGSVQIRVIDKLPTQVVPLRGSLIKLNYVAPQQAGTLSQAQLSQRAAAKEMQPLFHAHNFYSNFQVARPAIRLSPAEIRQLSTSVLRRPLPLPLDPIR